MATSNNLVRRHIEEGEQQAESGVPSKTSPFKPDNSEPTSSVPKIPFFKSRATTPAMKVAKNQKLVAKMRERGDFKGSSFGGEDEDDK